MVESGPIHSRVVKLLQCSLLAVSEFHIASKEHCEPDNGRVCAEFCCRMSWCLKKRIRMITAMYVSSVYFRFTTQEFSMIGGYINGLKKPAREISKLGGGHLPGTIRYRTCA